MRQFLFSTAVIGLSVYLILLGYLYFAQRTLLYHPDQTPYTPQDAGFQAMEVVTIETEDGLALQSWYQPAEPGKPTILYFHGNAGNLLNHSYIAHPLVREGYGILLLEYRGYGGNPGQVSEDGFYKDARAALGFLENEGIGARDIILFGQSLGTGVAIKMAAEIKPKALILQSPYTSIAEVGQHHYWYMPVKYLIKDSFKAIDFIDTNRAPLLVTIAEKDTVIPPKFSERLYNAAPQPKTMKIIKGAHHNNMSDNGNLQAVLDFLAGLE